VPEPLLLELVVLLVLLVECVDDGHPATTRIESAMQGTSKRG
jgi:hypothetical protein